MIEKQPDEITPCHVEAVLMPNGEIISLGKTIGWFKDYKGYLYEPNKEKQGWGWK